MSCSLMALLGGAFCSFGAGYAQSTGDLLPVPQHVMWGNGEEAIGTVHVVWDTPPTPLLQKAVARFERRLVRVPSVSGGPVYVVHLRIGQDAAYLTLQEREAYHLRIKQNGGTLDADGPAGALHGLATLLQLVERRPGGAAVLRHVDITDAPRFAWRGLVLDVSRHFITAESVKRQLDAMELVKLNVLHWHLSDGTGFRVQSHLFPKINAGGAYYTQQQVRDIVSYAADRGIRVVPEIDVPGHAYALLKAYPQLAAEPLPQPAYVGEKSNLPAMDPTNPETLNFIRALYAEMETLFPDLYFHAGGDEVAEKQWAENSHIRAYMEARHIPDVAALQGQFTAEIARILGRQGRIMIGWDEVSTAPVPQDVVIEGWRGSKWTARAVRSGHNVLVSSGYYLDLLRPAAEHYAVDPYDVTIDGLTPAQIAEAKPKPSAFVEAFRQDPNEAPLSEDEQKHVLGAETALWTELVSDQMLDARLWPRSAAVAERFWSSEQIRDVADMERRLVGVQNELEAAGLKAQEHMALLRHALTGGQDEVVLDNVLSALIPAPNYVLNRLHDRGVVDVEHGPAGVVDPDSTDVIRFNALAVRYAQGDHTGGRELKELLTRWAQSADAAQSVVQSSPRLSVLKDITHDLAFVAQAGLACLKGHALTDEENSALERQEMWRHNASNMLLAVRRPQAPGGVLVGIVPGVRALVQKR
ncbi:family 20 glycosylhydrolase [Neokomagataea sp. TBRC 2177]|uniref:beta-N-acetylhexosaminidase n=2 Tax=Neokomagataea anthophila TaxID=2826925 RepID=A0ABS5E9A1_9PROT|nr:family 20 glycosylhydrolase [Neokomagataea anthophila]